jgi:ribosomal protein L22|tara:strand:- start:238 stop:441 length:204 start_codon:yes stop_codon:yes gene_type:complete
MHFEDSNYKIRQYKYEQAIKVLEDVLEMKQDQIRMEPKQTMWKQHEWFLLRAIEMVEEDIPFLDPNY